MSDQPLGGVGNKVKKPIHWSRLGWLAVLVLIAGLAVTSLKPVSQAVRQALGVSRLLQAGASLSAEQLADPFVCLRGAGDPVLARQALPNLDDAYLQGVALCLAGEHEAGLAALQAAGAHSSAQVQQAAGTAALDAQSRVDTLVGLGLPDDELVAVLQKLSSMPEVEPYPALRALAQVANDRAETWQLWLRGADRLLGNKDPQAAMEWMQEGLSLAPLAVQGSLYQRLGRIVQTWPSSPDYPAALEDYNAALRGGGWIYPGDEANTHLFRGEVYRVLKDEFSPEQALQEFRTALNMRPGYYWALLSLGHVYLYDLKDLDQAEDYYQQALAQDGQQPNAYYYLGEVSMARGDNDAAMAWYRQALEKKPDWQAAIDRLSQLSSP